MLTGVPQGSPLSVVLYLIYSSGLLRIGEGVLGRRDRIFGFIDDKAIAVVGDSIAENLEKLKRLSEEGLEWAADSASLFDVAKYQLVHHTRRSTPPADALLPLVIAGKTIEPLPSAKYLGVIIDAKLSFKEHVDYAVGKGSASAIALTRLSTSARGMPHKFIRRLYMGLVVPHME